MCSGALSQVIQHSTEGRKQDLIWTQPSYARLIFFHFAARNISLGHLRWGDGRGLFMPLLRQVDAWPKTCFMATCELIAWLWQNALRSHDVKLAKDDDFAPAGIRRQFSNQHAMVCNVVLATWKASLRLCLLACNTLYLRLHARNKYHHFHRTSASHHGGHV